MHRCTSSAVGDESEAERVSSAILESAFGAIVVSFYEKSIVYALEFQERERVFGDAPFQALVMPLTCLEEGAPCRFVFRVCWLGYPHLASRAP